MINKKAKGCCKYDCDDYPSIDESGEILVNSLCRLCKHFKKFDLYTKEKEVKK